jgi:hypothetical protein
MLAVAFTVTVTDDDTGEVVVVVPPLPPLPPLDVVATPAVAVTFAVRFVVSVTCALPLASVFATDALSDPLSVVNVTGTDASALAPLSNTCAVIVDDPPDDDTVVGLALTDTPVAAAAPIAILIALVPVTDAPPDDAVIVAVPEVVPALNVAVARPLMSVSTVAGSIVPSVVVKITCVPLCGGVPADSKTCATSCVVPLIGSEVADEIRVIVEPVGAKSGTFWQATVVIAMVSTDRQIARNPAVLGRRVRAIFKILSILAP